MISGSTRLAAVIGDPVRHSLSPAIHNAAFEALDLDWVYVALPVAAGDGGRAVEAMRSLSIGGMSVTMPHKAAVAEAADGLTVAAEALGASNCLFWDGDRIIGDSTDGDGFVADYSATFAEPLVGKRVLVAGAGGAAKSIIEAVGRAGADKIVVSNRSADAALAAAALAPQAEVGTQGSPDETAWADVIINATSIGMAGGPDPAGSPIPAAALHEGQIVVDIVYQPVRTPLLIAAEAAGAKTGGGIGMLVHQAALAFRHWTGHEPPIETMAAVVERFKSV